MNVSEIKSLIKESNAKFSTEEISENVKYRMEYLPELKHEIRARIERVSDYQAKIENRENKEAIVRDYFLTPLMHTTVLERQGKLGCCGKLEREYYKFRAKHKKENTEFCFFMGKHCAEKFLLLINHPKLE